MQLRLELTNGKTFGKIMVAFDGSNDSMKAVRLAAALAKEFSSQLVVVHVYNSPMVIYGAGAALPIPNYKELEDSAKQVASDVLSRGLGLATEAGVTARGELLEAQSVVEALSEYAAHMEADLLVVGTRGMTGFKKLILGSVSSGLVGHSPCSVLVAR